MSATHAQGLQRGPADAQPEPLCAPPPLWSPHAIASSPRSLPRRVFEVLHSTGFYKAGELTGLIFAVIHANTQNVHNISVIKH